MDDKGYLLRLSREGEHQQQDFKYRVADACKLAKSVSAFANTDGGRLLDVPVGTAVFTTEKYRKMKQADMARKR